MARQKGILKLEGPIEDYSFYKSVYGYIVRRKGGASKEKIRQSPKFENLRQYQQEFAACSGAGKLIRQPLKPYIVQAPDHSLVWRLTALLQQVKDCDTLSARGRRTVSKGLATEQGRALLSGFAFNAGAPLGSLLKRPVAVANGQLTITGLEPKRDFAAPAGATHVQLSFINLCADFDAGQHYSAASHKVLTLDAIPTAIIMDAPLSGGGIFIYMLQVCFLQEVNGTLHALKDKSKNALEAVAVINNS